VLGKSTFNFLETETYGSFVYFVGERRAGDSITLAFYSFLKVAKFLVSPALLLPPG